LSVIFHYIVRNKRRQASDLILRLLFPLIGAAFVFYLIALLDSASLLLGSGWLALGLVYYAFKRFKKMDQNLAITDLENVI
jgi:putrescine importer